MSNKGKTPRGEEIFDFSSYPEDTLFHDRRTAAPAPGDEKPRQSVERKPKAERRKRIDPTTFEKQYTPEELEFMSAMQQFKVQTGKAFPTHGEVLRVAEKLGYRKNKQD